jgi:hypothetical protein
MAIPSAQGQTTQNQAPTNPTANAEYDRALDDYIHGRISVDVYLRIIQRRGKWSDQLIKDMSARPQVIERVAKWMRG